MSEQYARNELKREMIHKGNMKICQIEHLFIIRSINDPESNNKQALCLLSPAVVFIKVFTIISYFTIATHEGILTSSSSNVYPKLLLPSVIHCF